MNSFEDEMNSLLEVAAKADEEVKEGLRRCAKEILEARLERGQIESREKTIVGRVVADVAEFGIRAFMAKFAPDLLERQMDYRRRSVEYLRARYMQGEPYIRQLGGRDLYKFIKRLRMKGSLERLLDTFPSQPQPWPLPSYGNAYVVILPPSDSGLEPRKPPKYGFGPSEAQDNKDESNGQV